MKRLYKILIATTYGPRFYRPGKNVYMDDENPQTRRLLAKGRIVPACEAVEEVPETKVVVTKIEAPEEKPPVVHVARVEASENTPPPTVIIRDMQENEVREVVEPKPAKKRSRKKAAPSPKPAETETPTDIETPAEE